MSTKKAAVVMQTDFTKDISVCTMQGVCMMVDPELRTYHPNIIFPAKQALKTPPL